MKPEEALALLDRAAAQLNVTRQVHVQLQEAIECLRGAISKPDVEKQPVAEQAE